MRFLVNVWTEYAGSEATYKVEANSIEEVYPQAEDKAYEHSIELGLSEDVESDYPDLSEDELIDIIDDSYHYSVSKFEGTDGEWELYEDL